MDPILIGVGLIVVLILLLAFVFLVFNREQSFEDALAQQKAGSVALIEIKKETAKGVRQRKKPKKEKSRSEDEGNQTTKKTTKVPVRVPTTSTGSDFEDEIVVSPKFESTESTPEKATEPFESSEEEKITPKLIKKRPKEKRNAAQFGNSRGEQSPKEQGSTTKNVVSEPNIVEEIVQKTDSGPAYESAPALPCEEEILPRKEQEIQAEPGVVVTSKKSKKPKGSKEQKFSADSLNVTVLVETLVNSNLNNSEIQKLVDVLLDKQKNADQWKTPGSKPDPIDMLKKQLSEKEAAYDEEHTRANALAVKAKEIREELTQEKVKFKNVENTANQKVQILEKENQALQMRMNASHSNHSQENQTLRAALEQCKKNHGQLDWRQLQEELAGTKEILLRTKTEKAELESRVSSFKNDMSSRGDNESILLKQIAEAKERLVSSDVLQKSVSQQLQEAIKSKADSEHRLDMAKKELVTAQSGRGDASKKIDVLQGKLDTEKSKKSELEKMFRALEVKQNEESEKYTKEKEALLQKLQAASQNKNDESQLADLQKHLSEVSQQLEELRAQLAQSEEEHERARQALSAKEKQLGQHAGEIETLKGSNNSKNEEITALKQQLAVQQSEQEVIVQTSVTEDLQAAPDMFDDDSRVQELEAELEKLKSEHEEELGKVQGQLDEKKGVIEKMEKVAEAQKTKNNELREKNWKAMDAIAATEKQTKSEISKAVHSVKEESKKAQQQYFVDTKIFLCNIHPNISIDQNLSYGQFLKEYEIQAKELGCGSTSDDNTENDELQTKLEESSKKNLDLEAQCEKYKVTLGSTENLLRDLESNVEKEMENLKETVESKNAQLEKVNKSVDELNKKLKESADDSKSKDATISSLQKELSDKESVPDNSSELETLNSSLKELKGSLEKSEEEAKSKDTALSSLQKQLSDKENDVSKANQAVDDLTEKLKTATEDSKTKETTISSLEKQLSEKESVPDKSSELEKLSVSLDELKEKLRLSEEDAKSKDGKISSLEKDLGAKNVHLTTVTTSVGELKENVRKSGEDCKSKDERISSLEKELSTFKASAESSNNESKNELKKLSEDLERSKKQEKDLLVQLEAAKSEASKASENAAKSPDEEKVEKYKNDAEEASKVNAALRKELEEVRMECSDLKSGTPPKKKHKDHGEKVKMLEEKLALASKKETELQSRIALFEESKSTHSVDEEAPGSPEKKKKGKGFSLLGSKSSKYETKYKEMNEKYEHAKTESDEKSSKIAELEAKLQQSEVSLKTQDDKVRELSDNLKKAQDVVTNGGVQNAAKPLNESQMKQMAEAMTDGDKPGSAV